MNINDKVIFTLDGKIRFGVLIGVTTRLSVLGESKTLTIENTNFGSQEILEIAEDNAIDADGWNVNRTMLFIQGCEDSKEADRLKEKIEECQRTPATPMHPVIPLDQPPNPPTPASNNADVF